MKKLFLIAVSLFLIHSAQAQIKFGIKAGINSNEVDQEQLKISDDNDNESIGLSIAQASYGFHFGAFTQFKIGKIFLQPEVLFNSNSVDYKLDDLLDTNISTAVKNESYQFLDIPINLGIKLGPFRVQGGPVAHIFLDSKSELLDVNGYKQSFKGTNWGWQAGLGLDIWNIMLDARYEGNFNKYGDHIEFFDKNYNFDQSAGRFIFSLGIAF